MRTGEPLVEIRDLGIFYRLHRTKRVNLKHMLLNRNLLTRAPVHWALRHVNLSCQPGETWGVVGPNGAGKSTLCLVLSRILVPDEGEINVRGKVSTLVTLGAGLNRELSGRANIYLMGAFLGIPRKEIDERIEDIIAFTELGDFIDQPVRSYSSGMRSRLNFSVATELRPEILLLDEVLAVGDTAFRVKSQERMREMMGQSKLIVIVSHELDFLESICSHALWLEKGCVRGCGTAGQVLGDYREAVLGTRTSPRVARCTALPEYDPI